MITQIETLIDHIDPNAKKPTIVLCAAENIESLEALVFAHSHGIVDGILVGDQEKIEEMADNLSIDLSDFTLVHKPILEETIDKSLRLVSGNEDHILMKGNIRTSDLLKGVLDRQYNLRTDKILSHVSVLTSPKENRLIFLTDAGINISPDIGRKRDIITNAVSVAHTLGLDIPKVAVLSFIEKIRYPDNKSAIDAAVLSEMNRSGSIPGCIVEGPHALDSAISPESARIKGITGKVAGRADILVAHDINMGNAIYKTLQIWFDRVIAGIVIGSTKPIIVPSRADTEKSKLQSIALAVMLMQNKNENSNN